MKPSVQKILTKLAEEKTNNKNLEKVELGIADNLLKELSEIESIIKEVNAIEDLMKAAGKSLAIATKKANSAMSKGNKMLEKGYDITDRGKQLVEKAELASKELGVDPNAIKGFSEFVKKRNEAYFAVKSIEDSYWEYIHPERDKLDKF